MRLLMSNGIGAQDDAVELLVRIGAAAVGPLILALRYSNKDVRRRAAEALGKIGDVRAVEALVAVLMDSDEGVRHRATEALGKIGDVRAVEPLIKALSDSAESVRLAAANALTESKDARVVESPSVRDLILEIKHSYEISQSLRSSSPDSEGSSDVAMVGRAVPQTKIEEECEAVKKKLQSRFAGKLRRK